MYGCIGTLRLNFNRNPNCHRNRIDIQPSFFCSIAISVSRNHLSEPTKEIQTTKNQIQKSFECRTDIVATSMKIVESPCVLVSTSSSQLYGFIFKPFHKYMCRHQSQSLERQRRTHVLHGARYACGFILSSSPLPSSSSSTYDMIVSQAGRHWSAFHQSLYCLLLISFG